MRTYDMPCGNATLQKRSTQSAVLACRRVLHTCATVILTLVVCAKVAAAPDSATAGPDSDTSQAAFEFAFFVFRDFRLTPKLGIVYPPVLLDHFGVYKRREPAASKGRHQQPGSAQKSSPTMALKSRLLEILMRAL
jgi:hypothetical protein